MKNFANRKRFMRLRSRDSPVDVQEALVRDLRRMERRGEREEGEEGES